MQPISSQRLYRIQDSFPYFRTGRMKNGNQILIGVQQPELVWVEFDSDGNYLKTSTKEITWLTQGSSEFDEDSLFIELQNWQTEEGAKPGTISIKQFSLPERWIGIRDLPEHYQEVLDRPGDYDDERLRDLQEDIRRWRESGDFVLYWDEDYYLSQEGEVVSS